ncbi:TPA: hypothetical protein LT059_005222, partial [Salmonella enterica subsp. enterica serovar Kodjovi]|nr:hypothetical protein [Salmonella enterica subsp. enterica serovar Kodjovi]
TTREERRIRYITPNNPETESQDNEDNMPVSTALAGFRPLPALQDLSRKNSEGVEKTASHSQKPQKNDPGWTEKF